VKKKGEKERNEKEKERRERKEREKEERESLEQRIWSDVNLDKFMGVILIFYLF